MVTRPRIAAFTHPCPRPPQAVLFDLDGTLVDSGRVIAASYNAGLKATGHRLLSQADILAMLGPPLEQLYHKRIPKSDVAAACEAYRTTFAQLFAAHVTAAPGAVELLRELQERGIPTAVITNRARHTEEMLDRCGLRPYLRAIVAVTDGPYAPKPDPAMLYAAMEQLDAIPADTCYVGDSLVDMRAGGAAGTWTIGLTTLGQTPADLEAAGAHVVAADLTVLATVLGLREPVPAPAAGSGPEGGGAEAGPATAAAAATAPPAWRTVDDAAASLADQPVPMEAAELEADAPYEPAPALPDGCEKSDMPPEVEDSLDSQPIPMEVLLSADGGDRERAPAPPVARTGDQPAPDEERPRGEDAPQTHP